MPRYWWVNHKQTWRQEIEGQYLWSPKTKRNGTQSEFYNNMRRASPGDLVLSYAGAQIRYVGRVAEFAFSAPKPEEFGAHRRELEPGRLAAPGLLDEDRSPNSSEGLD